MRYTTMINPKMKRRCTQPNMSDIFLLFFFKRTMCSGKNLPLEVCAPLVQRHLRPRRGGRWAGQLLDRLPAEWRLKGMELGYKHFSIEFLLDNNNWVMCISKFLWSFGPVEVEYKVRVISNCPAHVLRCGGGGEVRMYDTHTVVRSDSDGLLHIV